MKHVFVETNFLIAAARPDSDPSAVGLLERARNGGLVVHLPWCCRAEAARTLDTKINEDLGFERLMARRALRERDKDPELHAVVQRFAAMLREERRLAKADVTGALDRVLGSLQIIPPPRPSSLER